MEAKRVFTLILFYFLSLLRISKGLFTQNIILEQGIVRGLTNLSNSYEAFLGIPYASVGERYKEAGDAPSWNGIFTASQGNIQCYQYSKTENKAVGQKDCLVLNIFKPNKIVHYGSYPVMVFIPGGALFGGSNSYKNYNPQYFVEKGVIFVTVNYRVGAFGFLCLNSTEASGNIGVKDQILALKWIKNNIKAFAGNPDSITVIGESAGSATLHFIILSEKYKTLFNKAILQSGSALQSTMFDNDPIKTASFVASRMGYDTSNAEELLTIFQSASTDEIINATHIDPINNPLGQYLFRPCVEDSDIVESPIISATPRKLLDVFSGDPNLKIIIGYNNKEGIFWAATFNESGIGVLNQNFEYVIPENIIFQNKEEKLQLAEKVKQFYFQGGLVNNTGDGLIDFFTDTVIAYPETLSYKSFLEKCVTVYNYYFEIDSNRNLNKFETTLSNKKGASHGDILNYEFEAEKTANITLTKVDADAINVITTLFTNFAKSGKPTAEDVKWIPSKMDDIQFLDINNTANGMIPMPTQKRINLWEEIYNMYDAY